MKLLLNVILGVLLIGVCFTTAVSAQNARSVFVIGWLSPNSTPLITSNIQCVVPAGQTPSGYYGIGSPTFTFLGDCSSAVFREDAENRYADIDAAGAYYPIINGVKATIPQYGTLKLTVVISKTDQPPLISNVRFVSIKRRLKIIAPWLQLLRGSISIL